MSVANTIKALLVEAAQRESEIFEIGETAENSWIARFNDADIDLVYDADVNQLFLSTEVGVVHATDKAAVYAALLGYNLMWADTGGVRFGLGPDRTAFLVADLNAGELSAELLAAALPNLIAKARIWRAVVATGGAGAERDDHLSTIAIRI